VLPSPEYGNEFTYTAAATGALTISVRVRIQPDTAQIRSVCENNIRIRITAIDDSHTTPAGGDVRLSWDHAFAGEATAGNGVYNAANQLWEATATFTKLPPDNDDFGAKAVTVHTLRGGTVVCSQDRNCQIFFPKMATNHPGGVANSPNWFHYWLQTVTPLGTPAPTFDYGTSSFFTPGTTTITLSDGDAGSYSAPYGTHNPLCGIDNFAWTVIHESQHYKDWLDFWNNNYEDWLNNHRGKPGPNDDKDGDMLPNKTEDVNLNSVYDAVDLYDWEDYNTPTPGRPAAIVNDFEDYDCQRHKGVTGDHNRDWSHPGMRHATDDKYDD